MVVIDPISAYLGGTDSHKNADVRALLGPLGELAAQHGLTIVCGEPPQQGRRRRRAAARHRLAGLRRRARSAFIVLKDKEQATRRLFLPIKNNLGSDCSGLAFELSGVTLDSAAGPIDTCHVVWDSEPVEMTANEAMSPTNASATTARRGYARAVARACCVPTVRRCRPRRPSGERRSGSRRGHSAVPAKS